MTRDGRGQGRYLSIKILYCIRCQGCKRFVSTTGKGIPHCVIYIGFLLFRSHRALCSISLLSVFFSFSIFCSGCCSMGRLVLNVACLVVALSVVAQLGSAQLRQNYYANICPNVESIVRGAVTTKFRHTFVTAPATLRLFFHDCFVEVNERNGTWVRLIRVF